MIRLRQVTQEEKKLINVDDKASKFCVACISGNKKALIVAEPVIDKSGNFNTRMNVLIKKGNDTLWFNKNKQKIHKKVNQFIIKQFDYVVISC